jgi:hypothetical protein
MPSIYKKAYNDSIGGMMYQIATGKKYYEIADVPRGIVHDIAAQMLSFFASKEDIGLMATSGGLAWYKRCSWCRCKEKSRRVCYTRCG